MVGWERDLIALMVNFLKLSYTTLESLIRVTWRLLIFQKKSPHDGPIKGMTFILFQEIPHDTCYLTLWISIKIPSWRPYLRNDGYSFPRRNPLMMFLTCITFIRDSRVLYSTLKLEAILSLNWALPVFGTIRMGRGWYGICKMVALYFLRLDPT